MAEFQGNEDVLAVELAIWSRRRKTPRLFLRDDDAVRVTTALDRLCDLTARWKIPLLLAIIPQPAKDELTAYLGARALITPAVHGFSHRNYAKADEKKIELGGHRNIEEVLEELATGREKLLRMFGSSLSHILVPPWNRIDADIAARVAEAGFSGISGFGWKTSHGPLPRVNTHVDIIDWKNSKKARSLEMVKSDLAYHLKKAREENFAPVGILTHHLVHDKACWNMLEELFALLHRHGNVEWMATDDLIIGG